MLLSCLLLQALTVVTAVPLLPQLQMAVTVAPLPLQAQMEVTAVLLPPQLQMVVTVAPLHQAKPLPHWK
jgi:hypothetical protein